ncbi:MAG: gliding motility-associated C-terminal domain-containing protein [Crocinitomicaceae bacterium]|nr:gliding motility-associated C-terminal domain-containing protein [Crocinitomicaceae bacterium]
MKRITAHILFFCLVTYGNAQVITSSTAIQTGTTTYSNGAPNNPIYFICAGQTGTLTATPTGGVPNWNFIWQVFVPASNSWNFLTAQNGLPVSTLTGLQPGGYRVTLIDANGIIINTDIAWICRIDATPSVDITPVTPGCGSVQLQGQINAGTITPYYNPPAEANNPNNSVPITSATQITVCFSAMHTYVSDLAFYLVGPPSCGSPTVLLLQNPCASGQGSLCNTGNNVNNLCFSTLSSNNLNICAPAPTPLTGTYGGYGPTFTPINWAPIYGCDATQPGWAVQIYDCIGLDVGALTNANLSFTGTTVGGNNTTVSYNSGSIYSAINDNSCSAATASIYTVTGPPPVAATPINFTSGYQWTSNPPVSIPNATSSLNITLNSGPTTNTIFTLTLTGNGPGTICGGSVTDTELYTYSPPFTPAIFPVNNTYCEDASAFNLNASPAGGAWSGQGITDVFNGTFSPAVAGVGLHTITYTFPGNPCASPATIQINVFPVVDPTISDPGSICQTGGTVDLSAVSPGGIFSGIGISDASLGIFDPMISGPGTFQITYDIPNACNNHGEITLTVFSPPVVSITPAGPFCIDDAPQNLVSSLPGGTWSGDGITDVSLGTFDPGIAGEGSAMVTYQIPATCPLIATTTIPVQGIPDIIISQPPVLCDESDPVSLTASPQGGSWSGEGITGVFTGTFDPILAGQGVHPVIYSITGICDASGQTDITVVGSPIINIIDPGDFCVGDAPVNLQVTPPGGQWQGAGLAENSFSPQDAGVGSHTLQYIMNDECLIISTLVVEVFALPQVNAGNDAELCEGETLQLNATGALDYQWSPSTALDFDNIPHPHTSATQDIVYTVTGISADGCSDSDQVVITVYPMPQLVVTEPEPIDQGQSVGLFAEGLINYLWTPDNYLQGGNTASPIATPPVTTVYTVSGSDQNGCYASADITVIVIPFESSLKVPNIITPNGDQNNQYFMVEQVAVKVLKIDIFNRWGEWVGSIEKPDGRWNAGDCSDGTYYYILSAEGYDGKKYAQQGNLTVVKEK